MEYMAKPTRQQHMSMRFMAIWMMLITSVLWMMQFIMNLIGVVGTTLATLKWTSMVTGVGVITAGSVVVGTAAWIVLLRGHMMKVFD